MKLGGEEKGKIRIKVNRNIMIQFDVILNLKVNVKL